MKRTLLNAAALTVVLAGSRYLHAEMDTGQVCCKTGWFDVTCCGATYCSASLVACQAY